MAAGPIERLSTRHVRVPLDGGRGGSGATEVEVVHVTVTDRDGASGTGFTYALQGGAEAVKAMIDGLFSKKVLGSDPIWWGRTWHELWAATHRLGRGVAIPALSAIDIAMWDLAGHRLGQPLYRLLGALRERVPIYGSGRATHRMSTDELVAGTLQYIDEGYEAVKLRAGVLGPVEDLKRIGAVRKAIGDRTRLMVDCNERLSFDEALWFGRRLEEQGVYWLEEPLRSEDVAGHARLASGLPISIAAGEHLIGRFEFAEWIRLGAAAVLQPDTPLLGGVSEWCRVSTLAEASNLALSPHFLPELHVHLAVAAPTCLYVEHFPLIDDLLEETLQSHGGVVFPPDRPGHGILWDDRALEKYTVDAIRLTS